MKAAFYTLGCKVNQYDTQMMSEKLIGAGYDICSFDNCADIYIINTCTVTQISDKKSRNIISRAKRLNPEAIIIVCGCFSQVSPEPVAQIDGVDIVIGTKNRVNIVNYINSYIKSKKQIVEVTNDGNLDDEQITSFSEKTRAILKIEDGCRNFCSYCLIPYARGKITSKPIKQVVKEATLIAKNGYKEIVLTGIHLSSYGKDLDNIDLADAINAVNNIEEIKRIRLGSLEPRIITKEFLDKISVANKLCPSFHLSLQSGCDKILSSMNRKYTASEYKNAVDLLRERFVDCSITTDIIVGFPGETDEDFNETIEFVKQIRFSKIHIFPFSVRKGTKAETMPDKVTKQAKQQRENILSQLEHEHRLAFNKNMIGKTVSVLVENFQDGICKGFTKNYINVEFKSDENLCNSIVDIKVIDSDNTTLFGTLK